MWGCLAGTFYEILPDFIVRFLKCGAVLLLRVWRSNRVRLMLPPYKSLRPGAFKRGHWRRLAKKSVYVSGGQEWLHQKTAAIYQYKVTPLFALIQDMLDNKSEYSVPHQALLVLWYQVLSRIDYLIYLGGVSDADRRKVVEWVPRICGNWFLGNGRPKEVTHADVGNTSNEDYVLLGKVLTSCLMGYAKNEWLHVCHNLLDELRQFVRTEKEQVCPPTPCSRCAAACHIFSSVIMSGRSMPISEAERNTLSKTISEMLVMILRRRRDSSECQNPPYRLAFESLNTLNSLLNFGASGSIFEPDLVGAQFDIFKLARDTEVHGRMQELSTRLLVDIGRERLSFRTRSALGTLLLDYIDQPYYEMKKRDQCEKLAQVCEESLVDQKDRLFFPQPIPKGNLLIDGVSLEGDLLEASSQGIKLFLQGFRTRQLHDSIELKDSSKAYRIDLKTPLQLLPDSSPENPYWAQFHRLRLSPSSNVPVMIKYASNTGTGVSLGLLRLRGNRQGI